MEAGERLLSINNVRPFSLAAGLMKMERGECRVNIGAVLRKEELYSKMKHLQFKK